jgi:multidrug resistance efflux pump
VFGTIRALDTRNTMLDFPASIEIVHVRDGQRVKKGDPLVTLNINEFKADINKKENELSVARLELVKNNDNAELQKLLNTLKYEEASYKKAEEELNNIGEMLYKAGAISTVQLEEYSNAVEERRRNVEEIKLSLNSLNNERVNNLKIQQEKISALDYAFNVLRDKLNKGYLINNVITTDIQNGLVYDLGYLPGDIVDPEKKVLSIINLDSIFVQADVAEEFIKDVSLNAPARIVLVADKSKKYQGRVVRISDKAMQKNGETIIAVDIAIDNKDDFLRPDFNVDVSIEMNN